MSEALLGAVFTRITCPHMNVKGKTMGAILELTSYAATPVGMVAIIAIGAAGYFAARWVLVD